MKSIYPEIARFKYKNKWLNIDIPLRVKKITLTKYYCKNCDKEGTQTQIFTYCEAHNEKNYFEKSVKKFSIEYDEEKRVFSPKEITENGKPTLCPTCYLKNINSKLKTNNTNLYKIYAPPNPEDIAMHKILYVKTAFNFRPARFNDLPKKNKPIQFAVYFESLEELKETLKDSRKYAVPRKKTEKCRLIIRKNQPTEKDLEHANYVSKQQTFLKKL